MANRSKKQGELLTQIYVMLTENTEMTKKMHKVIYEGNGKPSLLSRTDALESSAEEWKGMCEKVDSMLLKMAGIAGGISVVSFFAAYFLKSKGVI